jgi:2-polyprenyl-3-methyl-5-hydroxy-6-metoxy-1,4-benzoquinol methylase
MAASPYPTLADQQRYWDHRWQDTEAPNAWSRTRGDTILAWLRSLSLDRPRILDLGCGTGWFTAQLARYGQAIGIDLSETAIAAARERYPQATFLVGDLFQMSLPPEDFDVVVSQEVIAHVADQVGYLERAAQLLKRGGYVIVTTANKFVMERVDWPPQPSGHIEQWLNMKDLKRLLRTRFRILRATSILPMGHRGILRMLNSHKLNFLVRPLISPPHLDALKGRAGLGYTLIVLAQKR